jgi:sulfoxide reductase heme-binding subunit YedZ
MWRRTAIALALFFLVCLMVAAPALADGPTDNSAQTVAMSGQAALINSRFAQQLRLKTTSSATPTWLLEVTLTPIALEPNTHSGYPVYDVNGSFTLGISREPLSSGAVSGWVDGGGTGNLQLSASDSSSPLGMVFNLANDGSLTATVQGQWPQLPAPAASQTQPAQPSSHFFWYLSRVSALISYLLLFVTLALGLGLKTRSLDRVLDRWRALDLHKFTALLATGLIFLHIFALLGDGYFHYTLSQLLVPGLSPYRSAWVALGILGTYATIVVVVSSYLRSRIGEKVWQALHALYLFIFLAIFAHSLMSGTDTGQPWAQWLYISTGVVLVFLMLWRWLDSRFSSMKRVPAQPR